ncbi:MAG: rRNA pseudouridine synthase [Planctomycetaceae bacterium]|nr:rRNA pseudouridine synthase [Planctomycetaceae bacterium]
MRSEAGPDEAVEDDRERMRLQKFLATAGVDSRRNCEEYIRTGRVTVDSQPVLDPASLVDPESQDIRLDGERLRMPRYKYFLLNKPKGVLCTSRDPQGRPRAIDLVPSQGRRLFTVGRLDESTEGLLLITNDGDLAERLAHPRFEVVRRYRCHVAGVPTNDTLKQLREGMYFSDGFFRFRGVRVLKRKGRSVMLELELREGKNREIRRLLAKVGHKVITLERIAFGPLRIGYLSPGKFRELRPAEIGQLKQELEQMEKQRVVDSNRRPLRRPKADPAESTPDQGETSKSDARPSPRKPASSVGRPGGKGAAQKRGGPKKPAPAINKGRDRRRNK